MAICPRLETDYGFYTTAATSPQTENKTRTVIAVYRLTGNLLFHHKRPECAIESRSLAVSLRGSVFRDGERQGMGIGMGGIPSTRRLDIYIPKTAGMTVCRNTQPPRGFSRR